MDLAAQISKFTQNPFPLWETTLTHQLVQHKWRELENRGFQSPGGYSTAGIWLTNPSFELSKKKEVAEHVYVEMPSIQMQYFYNEHGLELLTENEIEANAVLLKIKKAISILRLIEPAYDCITGLVRSIHILRQPEAEIDLSYSHPDIPFSIFVSICEENSTISNLRVAESILHEAMHLKLTLIENVIPLIKPNANSLYYSPFRNEQRPVQGVLHGLFVFKAIDEFYKDLQKLKMDLDAEDYLKRRINEIKSDVELLKGFAANSSLTEVGANLAISLLPWN
jgi:hypothetical protein